MTRADTSRIWSVGLGFSGLLIVFAATGCGGADGGPGTSSVRTDAAAAAQQSDAATASASEIAGGLGWQDDRRIVTDDGLEFEVAQRPSNELSGYSPPRVQQLADASIIYNVWSDLGADADGAPIGRPSVVRLDPETGVEQTVAEGGYGMVVSGGGRTAWSHLASGAVTFGQPIVTSVRVAPSVEQVDEAETWLSGDRFTVHGWAGDALLVTAGGESDPTLLAVDGIDSIQPLGRRLPVAVSPDGSLVALTELGRAPNLEIWSLTEQRSLETVDVEGVAREGIGFGYWDADGLYLPTTPQPTRWSWDGNQLSLDSTASLPEGMAWYRALVADDTVHFLGVARNRDAVPDPEAGPDSTGSGPEIWELVATCDTGLDTCETGPPQDPLLFSAIVTEGASR